MDATGLGRLLGCATLAVLLASSPASASFDSFTPSGNGPDHPVAADGRATPVPWITALDAEGKEIQVDGRLDDAVWAEAEAGRGFRVWDPDRGAIPTEETVFKVAYDREAIYFAVACLEHDPSKVSSHLARRDRFSNSDLVSVYIDPYLDRTTGYNFRVNPRGVVTDAYMFNDGERDDDWDAVWQAETYRDEQGWYAEIRIPFSSIRYRPATSMTWGLQVYRYMHGRGEDTAWVTWDREMSGFISRFGEIRGIRDVPPPRQLEVLPYFLASGLDPAITGPEDDFRNRENFGADLKYGVTADLTLNATFQPDFGQVEADPAELNLSPFETQFEEKRPFFIEGSRFFAHPHFNLFYSRRIGTGDENSRIRFAGKLTGKTKSGVSIAALAATTDIAGDGRAHNPFVGGTRATHFLVGRVGKEFKDGNYRVNLMQTAVNKTADRAKYGDFLSREAYTSGLDFDLNFHDRMYKVAGSAVGSIVAPEVVAGDPASAAKIYGTGGHAVLAKNGGDYRGSLSARWKSDTLELNDVGFLSATDDMAAAAWLQYRYNPEGTSKVFNNANINLNAFHSWAYASRTGRDAVTDDVVWSYERGHRLYRSYNANGWMQFRNYYEAWWGVELDLEGTQRYETRGGPLMAEPQTSGVWAGGQTDSRRGFFFYVEGNYFRDLADNESWTASSGLHWTQSSALVHDLSANYRKRTDDTQYLETVDLAERPGGQGIGGRSYVFGDIRQKTLDVTLRSSLLFSRDQSLELYLQPFMTVGNYDRARELAAPDTYDLIPYLEPGYRADAFDFSFASVNLNAVYRWEYRPGSTIYLVWAHSRADYEQRSFAADPSRFGNPITTGSLFANEPENRFLAKVSYWFSL